MSAYLAVRRRPASRRPRMLLAPNLRRAILEAGMSAEERGVALALYDPSLAAFQKRFPQDDIAVAMGRLRSQLFTLNPPNP